VVPFSGIQLVGHQARYDALSAAAAASGSAEDEGSAYFPAYRRP
jgi:hypothetical protein